MRVRASSASGRDNPSVDYGAPNPWQTLVFLTFVSILMALDRAIPKFVTEPIKQEFALSDGQLGILLGIGYGIPYALAGLLLGPLIDRVNRKNYLALVVSIWSGFTLITGMSFNFLTLLLARTGLAAAESSGSPTAMSIISDVVPPDRRSTAIGTFKIGVPIGAMFASLLAAYVASTHGWRAAFYFAGIPGFLLALAMLLWMREPQRGAKEVTKAEVEPVPYRQALGFVMCNRSVSPLAAAMLVAVFSGAAMSGFIVAFLQRQHGLSLMEAGHYYAVGAALSSVSPILLGYLGDRIGRGGVQWTLLFLAVFTALIGAVSLFMVSVPQVSVAIGAFLFWQVLAQAQMTPALGVLISLTPPGMRGTVLSLVTVATTAIGYGTGPTVVGFVSDYIGGKSSLQMALIVVVGLSAALSAFLYLVSAFGLIHARRHELDVRDLPFAG